MACPPGMVLNPETLRCVRTTSRIAQELVRRGVIADYLVPPPQRGYRQGQGQRQRQRHQGPQPCRPDQVRNPLTGRCKKIARVTVRQPRGQNPYQYQYQQNPTPYQYQPIPTPIPIPYQYPRATKRQNRNRNPYQFSRRQLTEPPLRLPRGTSTAAPIGASMDWIRSNCRNQHDALTGTDFAYTNQYELQDVVRLHDRTCVSAQQLHNKVAAEHAAGRPATLPANHRSQMTTEDLAALRSAMRRYNPAYKIPSRRQYGQFQF